MNMQNSSTVKLNLPSGILNNAQKEALRIGISLQDFIRMLMATYFANSNGVKAISNDLSLFKQAKKEIEKGEYTTISDTNNLDAYLKTLES